MKKISIFMFQDTLREEEERVVNHHGKPRPVGSGDASENVRKTNICKVLMF